MFDRHIAGNALNTIQHLLWDAVILLLFLAIIYGFDWLMDAMWPNHSDPAFFGLHLHTAMTVIKYVTVVSWMSIAAIKLLYRAWKE